MLTNVVEWLQGKYYCNFSSKSKVFHQTNSKKLFQINATLTYKGNSNVAAKAEMLICLKLSHAASKFQLQIWGFRLRRARIRAEMTATTTDNWKWQ